jgi:hypothetical protein
VCFSGWVEYEIDNPEPLGDASASTPDEIDPEGKSNLRRASSIVVHRVAPTVNVAAGRPSDSAIGDSEKVR